MNYTYSALQSIWNRHPDIDFATVEHEIRALLSGQGIRMRQDDGELRQITLSRPTTIENSFVIGLRYMKRDGTCTEDHFLCRRDYQPSFATQEIEPYYKRQLEPRLPEYRGTHKQQVDLSQPLVVYGGPTEVNTISFLKGQK